MRFWKINQIIQCYTIRKINRIIQCYTIRKMEREKFYNSKTFPIKT